MNDRLVAAAGAGAYVGGTSAAALLLATNEPGIGSRQSVATIGAVLGVLAALAVGLSSGRFERLRTRRGGAALLAVPAASAIVAVTIEVVDPGEPGVHGLLASAVALAGGGAVIDAAKSGYARHVGEESERLAALPETDGRTLSGGLRAVNATAGSIALAGAFGSLVLGDGSWYVYVLFALAPLAVATESEREVWVTDRGLLFESRFRTRLLEWSTLEGYYPGADLVVFRSGRIRGELTFDGDAVDDEAVGALDRYLPRSETPTVPAGGLERRADGESGRRE